jgi:hypothetical protein
LHNKGNTTLDAGAVNKVLATQKCYDNESDWFVDGDSQTA